MTTTTAPAPRTQPRAIVAGKALDSMTAADLAAREPDAVEAVAEAERRLRAINDQVRHATDAELSPLRAARLEAQNDLEIARERLQGVKDARTQAEQRELDNAIASAGKTLAAELDKRLAVARDKVQAGADMMIAGMREMQALGVGAVDGARGKLNGKAGTGFRLTGTTGEGFRAPTIQRDMEIYLGTIAPEVWRVEEGLPMMRGFRDFASLTEAWHRQLLADFEIRFGSMQPRAGDGGESA